MRKNFGNFSPPAMALAWRLLDLSVLVVLWLQGRYGAEGLVFVLVLGIAAVARWRFPRMPTWTVVFDQAVCGAVMLLWPDGVYGLAIPILDASAAGAPWLALPALAINRGGRSLRDRKDKPRRVRHGLLDRQLRLPAHRQSLGRGKGARRLFGRLGRRRSRRARALRPRFGYRRLGPPAGILLRRRRTQAHLRRGFALRPRRLRLE